MSLRFPTLRDLAMRVVLVEELPREDLPMKKEFEALDRLPGNYTVTESSKEVIKTGGGVLSPWETECAESAAPAKFFSIERGGKIVVSKESCGVLWKFSDGTGHITISTKPTLYHEGGEGEEKIVAKYMSCICGGMVEEKFWVTEGGMELLSGITSGKATWKVDAKGKLSRTSKVLINLPTGAQVELTITVEAQRD